KTGTLTKGEPSLTDVVPIGPGSNPATVLRLAASAETNSEHPLAEAIVRAAREQALDLAQPESFDSIPGLGVEAKLDGRTILLGNRKLLFDISIDIGAATSEVTRLEGEGKTVVFVAIDGELAGVVAVADPIKETSVRAVSELKRLGLEVVMITGDNERTAN